MSKTVRILIIAGIILLPVLLMIIFIYNKLISIIMIILAVLALFVYYCMYIYLVDEKISEENPMIKILFFSNGKQVSEKSFDITKDICSFGRSENNDIVIDNECIGERQFSIKKKRNKKGIVYYNLENLSLTRKIYKADDENSLVRKNALLYCNSDNHYCIRGNDSYAEIFVYIPQT